MGGFNNHISLQKRSYSLHYFNIFDIFTTNFIALSVKVTLLKLLQLILFVSFKFLIHFQSNTKSIRWSFTNILFIYIVAKYIHFVWLFSVVIICSDDAELKPGDIFLTGHSFSIFYWNINSFSNHNVIEISLLGVYFTISKFDIIYLSETYLDLLALSTDANLDII